MENKRTIITSNENPDDIELNTDFDEEYKPGVRCIASPVYNADGTVIAAMGISGPGSRMTKKKLPALSKIVSEVGLNLSSALGFSKLKFL